jgi:hypothetical protein
MSLGKKEEIKEIKWIINLQTPFFFSNRRQVRVQVQQRQDPWRKDWCIRMYNKIGFINPRKLGASQINSGYPISKLSVMKLKPLSLLCDSLPMDDPIIPLVQPGKTGSVGLIMMIKIHVVMPILCDFALRDCRRRETHH